MLGELEVTALGLGCMGMSEFYGETDDARSEETIQKAIQMGINFIDTADMYGYGHNELLVGKAIKPYRQKLIIATKFGIVRKKEEPHFRQIRGDRAYIRQQCEMSLKLLGINTIDLYYQHRVDLNTPIEETISAMAELIQEGKIRYIGLSEANPDIIKRAHAVHPITALQTEYSLWSRHPEKEILKLCKDLKIGFVAYSPIGRGFLSGRIKKIDDFSIQDMRKTLPRFNDENFEHNLKIVKAVEEMAIRKKCTPSQLALAWVLAQSAHIVPIFGTTRVEHLKENIQALDVKLASEDLEILNKLIPPGAAKGDRYGTTSMQAYKLDE